MKEITAIHRKYVEIIKDTYTTLRLAKLPREQAFCLEEKLANSIVNAEEELSEAKREQNEKLRSLLAWGRLVLKRIADGLAWRYFGFDELLVKMFAFGPPIGYMAGKSGYLTERFAVDLCRRESRILFAMQNDATNILRLGDVTVLLENSEIIPIEVKSSERGVKSKRAQRQIQRYDELMQYIDTGNAEGLTIVDSSRREVSAEHEYKYDWDSLEFCIERSLKEGCSSISPEDGIILISCHHSLVNAEKLANLISAALQQYHWDNACIRFGSLNRHFDNLDRNRLRFIIPFTYFDINPQAGLPVLLGDIVAYSFLDENRVKHELERKLERKGYKFYYDNQRLMMTSPNGQILGIEQNMWDRTIYGLLSLQSFVETIELVCQWAESELDEDF